MEKDKIHILIGEEVSGSRLIGHLLSQKNNSLEIVRINDTLLINGIRYKKKEINKPEGRRGLLTALMTNAMAYVNPYSLNDPPVERKRPTVNIEKEFELIGQKKSTLSRSDRDWVVHQFNKIYIPL